MLIWMMNRRVSRIRRGLSALTVILVKLLYGEGVGPVLRDFVMHVCNSSYFMNDDIAHFYSGGVYSRLRGRDRPLSLKRNKIKPRTKHSSKYSV